MRLFISQLRDMKSETESQLRDINNVAMRNKVARCRNFEK